jgi:hypothetical protein
MSRADLFALNSYSWCGAEATYQTSGYDKLVEQFSNSSIPIFFSEYGCNKILPRTFDEVPTLYGQDVTAVMSGGIVYQWTQDTADYGLVEIARSGDDTKLRADYDNLQAQFGKLDIPALQKVPTGKTNTAPPTCSKDLITDPDFPTSFKLPPVPKGGQELIDNGIPNPPKGKLVDVKDTKVEKKVVDSQGKTLQNLAISKLPDDARSNGPVTVSSVAPGGTSTSTPAPKKGGAGRVAAVNAGWMALALVCATLSMALLG